MTPSLKSWIAGTIPAMTTLLFLLAVVGWAALCDAARAQSPGAANYELLTPSGAGPFPAVVVMHGCDGINANTRR